MKKRAEPWPRHAAKLRGREGESRRGNMMRALALRVALSVLLFLCILGAYWMGWIQPTGLPVGR